MFYLDIPRKAPNEIPSFPTDPFPQKEPDEVPDVPPDRLPPQGPDEVPIKDLKQD